MGKVSIMDIVKLSKKLKVRFSFLKKVKIGFLLEQYSCSSRHAISAEKRSLAVFKDSLNWPTGCRAAKRHKDIDLSVRVCWICSRSV